MQVMESGRRYARWNMQLQSGQESMKSLTDCSFVDAAALREGEQRPLGSSGPAMPFLYVAFKALRQIRTQRHDSTFAKLGFPNEEQITTEIGVGQFQPNHFTYS
jgi:hypothetical protein